MVEKGLGSGYMKDLEESLMGFVRPREGARLNRGLSGFEMYQYIEVVDRDVVEGREVQDSVVTSEVGTRDGAFVIETGVAFVSARSSDGGKESKYQGVNYDRAFGFRTVFEGGETALFGVLDGMADGIKTTNGVEDAVELFSKNFRAGYSLEESAELVNSDLAEKRSFLNGSTGVLMQLGGWDNDENKIVDPLKATVVYAGDAKMLTIRDKEKLEGGTTKFQSLAQKDIDEGKILEKDLYNHPNLNVVLNSFGGGKSELGGMGELSFDAKKGDKMIMASDGFWDVVSEYEAIELSKKYAGQALQDKLFQLAINRQGANDIINIQHEQGVFIEKDMKHIVNNRGGVLKRADNVTVTVVEIDPIN